MIIVKCTNIGGRWRPNRLDELRQAERAAGQRYAQREAANQYAEDVAQFRRPPGVPGRRG